VGDFPGHQELQRVLGAGVIREVDEPLIDDFRAGFGGDVAAQVDVQLPGDLQVVGRPRVALRVEQVDAAATGDGDERIGLSRIAIEFHRLEVEAGKRPHDLEMAELFRADVHQQILTFGIVAVESLNGILHRGCELAIRAAELFEQHVAEFGIRSVHSHRVHQLLHVVIHAASS
jgi:hypothetical protein